MWHGVDALRAAAASRLRVKIDPTDPCCSSTDCILVLSGLDAKEEGAVSGRVYGVARLHDTRSMMPSDAPRAARRCGRESNDLQYLDADGCYAAKQFVVRNNESVRGLVTCYHGVRSEVMLFNLLVLTGGSAGTIVAY